MEQIKPSIKLENKKENERKKPENRICKCNIS